MRLIAGARQIILWKLCGNNVRVISCAALKVRSRNTFLLLRSEMFRTSVGLKEYQDSVPLQETGKKPKKQEVTSIPFHCIFIHSHSLQSRLLLEKLPFHRKKPWAGPGSDGQTLLWMTAWIKEKERWNRGKGRWQREESNIHLTYVTVLVRWDSLWRAEEGSDSSTSLSKPTNQSETCHLMGPGSDTFPCIWTLTKKRIA